MTPAYIKCVKAKFETMRDAGELGRGYVTPTRAFIRDECLRLFPIRSGPKDMETLADFFNYDKEDGTLLETIDRVNLEDLRALQNFLSGDTKKPNYKVVEMLAWLIDFEPRPYNPTIDYSIFLPGELHKPDSIGGDTGNEQTNESATAFGSNTPTSNPSSQTQPIKWKNIAIASASTLVLGFAGYKALDNGKDRTGDAACMYWNGQQYVRTDCLPKGGDTIVIPFDKQRLENFRRITRPDTITSHSVGKLYCIKINNQYEYYTAGGVHPLDRNRDLKRLTKYILDHHILKKEEDPNQGK